MSAEPLTLESLAARVAALESVQADQLVPGVFSLNNAGELEEKLSGKLEAKGINFNIEAPGEARYIQWLNTLGIGVSAGIDAQIHYTGVHGLPPWFSFLELFNTDGLGTSSLLLQSGSAGKPASAASVKAIAAGGEAVVINGSAQSNFLQLGAGFLPGSLGKAFISVGSAEVEWNGTEKSNYTEITGLPAGWTNTIKPFAFLQGEAFMEIQALTETSFKMRGMRLGLGAIGAGTKSQVGWMAITH